MRAPLLLALLGATACAPRKAPPPPLPAAPQVEPSNEPLPAPRLAPAPPEKRLTFNAQNADVRRLLPLLAEAAGLSLVLGPEVQGTVTVYFRDVPASEALEIVLEQAGLSASTGRIEPPYGDVVFYAPAVNIDRADVETIRARFGVSSEMARWIVANRIR